MSLIKAINFKRKFKEKRKTYFPQTQFGKHTANKFSFKSSPLA